MEGELSDPRNVPKSLNNLNNTISCNLCYNKNYMSLKRPQIDPQRRQELKLLYEEEFDRAITEEREKVDLQIMPQLSYV